MSPLHLTTSFEGAPEVVVPGRDVAETERRDILSGITLTAWPDGASVDFSVVEVAPDAYSTYPEYRFVVQPTAALRDGWYELSLVVPPGFLPPSGAIDVGPRGHAVRFHVGSLPMVRHVSFSPGDTQVAVRLSLSERVRDDRSVADLVSVVVRGARVRCEGSGADVSSPDGVESLSLVCDWFDANQEVSLEIRDDIRTIDGVALTTGTPSPGRLVVHPVRGGLLVDEEVIAARSRELRRAPR